MSTWSHRSFRAESSAQNDAQTHAFCLAFTTSLEAGQHWVLHIPMRPRTTPFTRDRRRSSSLPRPASSHIPFVSRSGRRPWAAALVLLLLLWVGWYTKQIRILFGPDRDDRPYWEAVRAYQESLPQHDLSLPYPEGRAGRYVRFSQQIKGLGWGNMLTEM
jgi:hypothetical protein